MYGLFPRETFPPTFLLEIGPGIFQVYILGTPPLPHTLEMLHNNLLIFYKLIWFTNILQPTFKEGTGSFVSGDPYKPNGEPPNQPTFEESKDFFMGSFVTFWGGGGLQSLF